MVENLSGVCQQNNVFIADKSNWTGIGSELHSAKGLKYEIKYSADEFLYIFWTKQNHQTANETQKNCAQISNSNECIKRITDIKQKLKK